MLSEKQQRKIRKYLDLMEKWNVSSGLFSNVI
jgi:16S rRNA G527 N7-methylase RsmG